MTRLLLMLIPCILLPPSIILLLPKNISKDLFTVILIVGVLLIPILIYLSIKSQYSNETVEIKNSSLMSVKYGEIHLKDISKIKFEAYKGYRIRLYLSNGLVIGISPFNQFSSKSSHQLNEFYIELMNRKKDIANTRLAQEPDYDSCSEANRC